MDPTQNTAFKSFTCEQADCNPLSTSNKDCVLDGSQCVNAFLQMCEEEAGMGWYKDPTIVKLSDYVTTPEDLKALNTNDLPEQMTKDLFDEGCDELDFHYKGHGSTAAGSLLPQVARYCLSYCDPSKISCRSMGCSMFGDEDRIMQEVAELQVQLEEMSSICEISLSGNCTVETYPRSVYDVPKMSFEVTANKCDVGFTPCVDLQNCGLAHFLLDDEVICSDSDGSRRTYLCDCGIEKPTGSKCGFNAEMGLFGDLMGANFNNFSCTWKPEDEVGEQLPVCAERAGTTCSRRAYRRGHKIRCRKISDLSEHRLECCRTGRIFSREFRRDYSCAGGVRSCEYHDICTASPCQRVGQVVECTMDGDVVPMICVSPEQLGLEGDDLAWLPREAFEFLQETLGTPQESAE